MLVIGSYVSPYVRKVLACLEIKGLAYEIDPITPFFGDDRFSKLSPLRRIPVLIDGEVVLSDSSVICQYLEERYPERPILPARVEDRARARWLEEYADSRMGDVFIWKLFYPLVVRVAVWSERGDREAILAEAHREAALVLDYLEAELPAEGFLFGEIGLADAAIAAFFRNAAWARYAIDAARWPKAAAFVARTLAAPPLAALAPFEDILMRTPIAQHRQALADAGAPVSAQSYAAPEPRRGVMAI
jgi:glutathione S-transferase